jgi:hypothetical protein
LPKERRKTLHFLVNSGSGCKFLSENQSGNELAQLLLIHFSPSRQGSGKFNTGRNGDRTMTLKRTFGAAVAGAALLVAAGGAHAVPTATIDGITVPVGIVAGGNQIQSGILDESLITATGQTLTGIGIVNTIRQGLTSTWNDGQNGRELAFFFTGYVASTATFPNITFTGGTAQFWSLPAGTNIGGGASLAADITTITTTPGAKLFLSVNAAPEDALGETLVSQITTGVSLSNFAAGDGNGFLDVTGGDAAGAFATRTFANAFDTGGLSDLTLTSDFTLGSTVPGAGVSGSATIKANAVPEPLSVGVLGLGLAALGAIRRRKR